LRPQAEIEAKRQVEAQMAENGSRRLIIWQRSKEQGA